MQTIFDTIIFVLIICKALSAVLATKRAGRGGPLFKENSVMAVIASQGVAYYGYVRNVKFIFYADMHQYAILISTL